MPIRFDHKPGLVVYLTAGDPSLEATRAIAHRGHRCGRGRDRAGRALQRSAGRRPGHSARQRTRPRPRHRLKDVLALAGEIRAARPAAGLVIFSYLNPILRYGLRKFADDAAAAGVDGVLVTDMIVEEAGEYLAEMARVGLAPIFLAAPTSPDERLEAIATHSKGFVYAISRTGITGKQQSAHHRCRRARCAHPAMDTLPVAVGFGISNAEHVAQVAEFADAAVVGSAIVELIETLDTGDSARRGGSIYQGSAPGSCGAGPLRIASCSFWLSVFSGNGLSRFGSNPQQEQEADAEQPIPTQERKRPVRESIAQLTGPERNTRIR